jgi:methionyl-tRNA formyltransferase
MKIVFIGTVEFSEVALKKLLELKANVVGVITKEKSELNSDYVDLSYLAVENNIPFKYVKDVNHPNNVKWINLFTPDVIFCFGWSSLLKEEVLMSSRLGVVGYHPSLLPYNRGRHPIIWSLALGLIKTGSSFFFMDEGADTGDILDQDEVPIHFEDNARSLYDKLTSTAMNQLQRFLPLLQANSYTRIKQRAGIGNVWRKRGRNDGLIDFRMPSLSIYNLTRALSRPYVGAHCLYRNQEIKIWEVVPIMKGENNIEPGKVLSVDGGEISVKTGDGVVTIKSHEFFHLPNEGEYLL